MLAEWPDALHITLLRHLGGPGSIEGYLWPYSAVCSSCAAAVKAPALWRDLDFSDGRASSLCSEEILQVLERFGAGATERLCLRGLEAVDDDLLRGIARLFESGPLRSLDVGGCPRVTGGALPACGAIATLEELGAECIASLQDSDLSDLCRRCPTLSRLDVRFCESLSNVSVLTRRSDIWAALQLDGCFRLHVADMFRVSTPGAWQGLRELSLDGEDLDAQQFALVSSTFPGLRRLAVSFARELDVPALQELATLRCLDSLALRKAAKPLDGDWADFFSSQRATRLSAASGTIAAIAAADGVPEVLGLDLVGGEAGDPAPGRGESAAAAAVAAAAAAAGGTPAQQWRSLNVAECEHFSDIAALAFAAGPLPRLNELDLSWCWHLSDLGLSALLDAAPGLSRVKLAGMKSVTATGIAPCCRMPSLVDLDCTSCNNVADTMLEFLHRLFVAPPGTGGPAGAVPAAEEPLPSAAQLPPIVARSAEALWRKRSRGAGRLRVKNYYAEYLQDWGQLRPAKEVCQAAELLLAAASRITDGDGDGGGGG